MITEDGNRGSAIEPENVVAIMKRRERERSPLGADEKWRTCWVRRQGCRMRKQLTFGKKARKWTDGMETSDGHVP